MAAQDLGAKMDALIRLMALQLIGGKSGADAIALLGRAGLNSEVIAEILGTTPATVRSAQSRARRLVGRSVSKQPRTPDQGGSE